MKFVLLVIALIIAMVAAAPLAEDQYQFLFTRFVQQYNKQYESNDFFGRFNIFKSNLNKIIAHNSRAEQWTMAVNQYADLSEVEFMSFMGFKPVQKLGQQQEQQQPCGLNTNVKLSPIDWRNKEGILNPVKDQGSCGSCWAFSTNQALESAYAIKYNKLFNLSEQQLVDCSGSTGNEGCNGGLMDLAYDYLKSFGGSCETSEYAYTARDGSCKDSSCTPVIKVEGYQRVGAGTQAVYQALEQGPVAVALAATSSFQFYSKGIFSDCGSTSLNHAVGLVGFTQEAGTDAWIIRNSWGASWGLEGHILLDASKDNCLGMTNTASKWNVYPLV